MRIVAGTAHPEREITMHAVVATADLVRQFSFARGQRIGVRHLEDGGDPAHHGGAGPCLQIFFVLKPRLSEMHLGVDDARQDVQPHGVDHLASARRIEVPYGDDLAVLDPYIARTDAVVG